MRPFEHGADLVLPLGDQVPFGAWRGDRRRARRFAAVSTGTAGAARGKFPTLTEPYARFSRHGVRRGVDDRRVPAARAARRHPRFRRLHGAVHRVPDPAGHRDAAAAHGSGTSRTRARSSRSSPHIRWSRRSAIPSCREPSRPCAGASGCCRAAAARCSASTSRGTRAQGRKFIESLRIFSRTSPTSATPSRW